MRGQGFAFDKKYFSFYFSSFFCGTTLSSNVLIHNDSHYIVKNNIGNYVEFFIELISDFEDNIDGKYPDVDFFMIHHDVNGNGKIDANIDRYYTYSGGQRCAGFILTPNSKTHCSTLKTEAKVSAYFSKSKIQERPHPIFKYLMPANELFGEDDFAFLVFSIYTKGKGSVSYPANNGVSFDNTLKIKK